MEEEKFTDGFKSRIVEFARAQYDKGQNNFEMFCGIPIGSINGPKKNGMAAINLAKIAERCPELSLRWLLLGEGEMLERGGGAHLSSHSHIPGASASSGPPPPSTSAMAALTSESVESASSLSSKPALISFSRLSAVRSPDICRRAFHLAVRTLRPVDFL